jgi:hypothetical protein
VMMAASTQGLADGYEADPDTTVTTLAHALHLAEEEGRGEEATYVTGAAPITGGRLLTCGMLPAC